MGLAKCKKCKWIHFEIDASHRDAPACTKCFRCGNSYLDFEELDKSDEDELFGSTVQPILNRDAQKVPRK